VITTTDLLKAIIEGGARTAMTLEDIITLEIEEWLTSPLRELMLTGERYYRGEPDILQRKRTVIGPGGEEIEAKHLANNRLAHNFVRKLVDQKVGYLLGLPLSVQTDNEQYLQLLNQIFDRRFLRLLQSVGREAINKGKAWVHVYYDEAGKLAFALIPSEEVIPLWKDAGHTELQAVIRVYEVETYKGRQKELVTHVEYWDTTGVRRYVLDGDGLVEDIEAGGHGSHFTAIVDGQEKGFNWERVPFVCFRYNTDEIPFIKFVKTLVDDYDARASDNSNNLQDLPNSIYVVRNYDGTDLGEFRRNLSVYRAVKVTDEGGVDTLSLTIDTEAYKTHMQMLRKDIYEFGRGVDTQSERYGSSPSGIALKFLYADLDMDCNIMETEFQASLEQLLWFVNQYLATTTGVDYSGERVDFVFSRDILINESETIANVRNSVGILSEQTIVANHPWVTDVGAELERIRQERQEDLDRLGYNSLGGAAQEGEGE